MPCSDGGPDNDAAYGGRSYSSIEYKDNPEIKKRLDRVTRLLCALIRSIEIQRGYIEAKTLMDRSEYPEELISWWKTHQREDAKRIAKEVQKKKDKLMKQQALNKLSKEERKLLGL